MNTYCSAGAIKRAFGKLLETRATECVNLVFLSPERNTKSGCYNSISPTFQFYVENYFAHFTLHYPIVDCPDRKRQTRLTTIEALILAR